MTTELGLGAFVKRAMLFLGQTNLQISELFHYEKLILEAEGACLAQGQLQFNPWVRI